MRGALGPIYLPADMKGYIPAGLKKILLEMRAIHMFSIMIRNIQACRVLNKRTIAVKILTIATIFFLLQAQSVPNFYYRNVNKPQRFLISTKNS